MTLARCPARGCPFRWRHGPDRPCYDHRDTPSAIEDAAAELGIVMTAMPGRDRMVPGQQDGGTSCEPSPAARDGAPAIGA